MIIKFIPNQFDKKDRKELDIECNGKTVKQYLRKHFKKSTKDLACVVSGKRVEWDHVPCKDDEVSTGVKESVKFPDGNLVALWRTAILTIAFKKRYYFPVWINLLCSPSFIINKNKCVFLWYIGCNVIYCL